MVYPFATAQGRHVITWHPEGLMASRIQVLMAVSAIIGIGAGNSNDRKEVVPFFTIQAVDMAWPNRLQVLER